jgi:hypothetical protein
MTIPAERRAVALGLTFGAMGFAVYGLAPTGPIFWIGVPVMARGVSRRRPCKPS